LDGNVSLAEAKQRIIDELRDQLSVLQGNFPLGTLGKVYEEIGELFVGLACCSLLLDADVFKYQRQLTWSAYSRRRYLKRCKAATVVGDLYQARSRSEAVFCALAAGDQKLGVEIGDLSPDGPIADGEYPDDFAYHRLVHAMAATATDDTLTDLVARYEKELDGGPSERLDVMTALCARDVAAFESAFPALVIVQASAMEEERIVNAEIPSFEPRSSLFIEGLALLRLAEERGMRPGQEYLPLCPSLARVNPLLEQPEDLFAYL